MTKVKLSIEGMHCGSCASGIEMYAATLDGVSSIHVDYNAKTGEVEFDEAKVKLEDILKGIAELGYKATVSH